MEKRITTAAQHDVAPSRLLELEQCEMVIRTAFRRGLDATLEMVAALKRIEREELWTEREECRGKTFSFYVENFLKWDLRSVYRVKQVEETIRELSEAGLPLPENESQVIELAKLDAEVRSPVWKGLLSWSDRKGEPITVSKVRRAVELEMEARAEAQAEAKAEEQKEKGRPGITATLDLGEEPSKPRPVPMTANEKTLLAIERLRKLCGDDVANAILSGTLPLADREIQRWAEQEDDMVRNITYYVVNRRWTVQQAITEENRQIYGGTTVDELINFARAHGGRFAVEQNDARVLVEILSEQN
jgi:hypothetical protein